MKHFYKILLILLVSILILSVPQAVLAGFSVGLPFGGMILFAIPCTCNASTLLIVGPPVPGAYMLTPATIILCMRTLNPFQAVGY